MSRARAARRARSSLASLWVAGSLGTGGYQAAFQANTTSLWMAGSAGTGALNLGMNTHTSPAITP